MADDTNSNGVQPVAAAETDSTAAQAVRTEEDALAAKRREVEEKVAALKLQRAKEEEQRTNFFGEHPGITCDGCGTVPIIGYRYRCKSCANHDVCETCYDAWTSGKVANGLGKQVISKDPSDHSFALHKARLHRVFACMRAPTC